MTNRAEINILFLTKYDRLGASSRYRSYQYIPYLEDNGIHCTVQPFFDARYLQSFYQSKKKNLFSYAASIVRRLKILLTIKKYDLLVIEKELIPYFPAILERTIRLLGIPFLVDYDDALFHRYDNHPNAIIRFLLGRKIAEVMRQADAVVAGNPYLADYACQSGARTVHQLPTVIDLIKYPLKTLISRSTDFTIGWIGSPTTTMHLESIAPVLTALGKNGGIRLLLIGARQIQIPGIITEVVPWTDETEVSLMDQFDVGIMPLPDEPWERGKCGFKLIQYMACGLPVVASSVGVNNKIVRHGENGFLASTAEEWEAALMLLLEDPELCQRMGINGRAQVESEYSLQVQAPRYAKILRAAVR